MHWKCILYASRSVLLWTEWTVTNWKIEESNILKITWDFGENLLQCYCVFVVWGLYPFGYSSLAYSCGLFSVSHENLPAWICEENLGILFSSIFQRFEKSQWKEIDPWFHQKSSRPFFSKRTRASVSCYHLMFIDSSHCLPLQVRLLFYMLLHKTFKNYFEAFRKN